MVRPTAEASGLPRWRGEPGRLEVWYATLTDPVTKAGFWIHHELVAPLAGPAQLHGWVALFPPDGPAQWSRFGPVPIENRAMLCAGNLWVQGGGCSISSERLAGQTDTMRWELAWSSSSPPLYTFPAWSWRRELLPAAHMLPAPSAVFTGTFSQGNRTYQLTRATGALARIYGKGNAWRWAWLHADLGHGDVLEIVAAASHRRLFRPLGMVPFVQLRYHGRDWPPDPLLAALGFRAKIENDSFRVWGSWRGRALDVVVDIPKDSQVTLDYHDPDGGHALCTNSERASARIQLSQRGLSQPNEWRLEQSAHAEIGRRPSATG
jgi:hypothetical protein